MKIYTRRGDAGTTGLLGGGRVSKVHPRVEAYGTVDELNAVLGWAAVEVSQDDIRERLEPLQHDLFAIGADLAVGTDGGTRPQVPGVPEARVAEMEGWIDTVDEEVPPLRAFILPGGSRGAAALHVARTVCRRAERSVVALAEADDVDALVLRYLNRLSDLLFALARLENHRSGATDVAWRKPEPE